MAKKVQKGFLFDQNFCIGCKACEVSCQVYHRQEPEINWRKVETHIVVEDGMKKERFTTSSCHHCEDPKCLEVCPTYAYTKREDGIVVLDREKCISCGLCVEECEYGAITRLGEDKKAQKCNMCAEKQDRGEEPACVAACPMDVLRLVDTDVSDRAGMVKEAVGFKANDFKPSVRFYPKFKTGMKTKLL